MSRKHNSRVKEPTSRNSSILEQLELDICELDKEPLRAQSSYLLLDDSLKVIEYDHSVAEILGIKMFGERTLLNCSRLNGKQVRRISQLVKVITRSNDANEERYLRIEVPTPKGVDVYCLSFQRRESEDGRPEAICLVEPIITDREKITQAAPNIEDATLDLWSMNPETLLFEMVSNVKNGEIPNNEMRSYHLDKWIDRVGEDDRTRFREGFLSLIEGELDSFHMRYRFRRTNGELKWVSTIARRSDDASRVILGLHRDESEMPSSLDELKLFSYLAKKVQLSILVTDASGRITWCNNAFTQLAGYELSEIIGKSPGSVLQGPLSDQNTIEYMRSRIRKQKAFHAELINYKKNGVPFWTRIDANPLVNENGEVTRFIAFQTDISESRKTQSAIIRTEVKFRSLFDNSQDALLLLAPRDGMIIEANRAAVRFFDSTRLVGIRLEDLFSDHELFSPDSLNDMVENSEDHARESTVYVSEGGDRRPVELSVNRTSIGEAIALIVTIRDVSDKKQLEEQLRHTHRMEAVGRLAGGIAHDFNNLLAGLRGFSELLCNSRDLTRKDHVYSKEILKITDRASKLTSRLLSFSRGKSDKPIVANLNGIVGDLTPMLSRILRKDIYFTSRLDPKLRNVKVDPTQIEQVIMNLVMNGQEAISTLDGTVLLETRMVDLDGNELFITGKPKPGNYASISVKDNGHGIPKDVLKKIFEPFFTTKKGAGTGLGLSIVYGIIQSNGGHLMVRSEAGKGAEFAFYFPAVVDKVESVESIDDSIRMPSAHIEEGSAPTILVAEDQDQVREILDLGLGQSGYNLLIARDGKEAYDLAKEYEGTVDLLLTDSIMPRMQGCQLACEIRKLYPEVKVMLMSGLPMADSLECRNARVDVCIDKPFSIRKLLEDIETLLRVAR